MKIRGRIWIPLLAVLLLVAGCAGAEQQPKFTTGKNTYNSAAKQEQSTEEPSEQSTSVTGLHVVVNIDTQSEMLTLQKVENGKLLERSYNSGTCFYNKYGSIMSLARLELGSVVTFRATDDGILTEVTVSDQAWERGQVKKYRIDEERNVFTIGTSNYAIDEDTNFFSDDGTILVNDIGDGDELRVWGIDRRILSVTVTTGHGEIELYGTDVFEGGYIMLSGAQKYYYEITSGMTIEVPEGDYRLTAAGNGYGGSMDITVTRDETVTADLDMIKGEGPKSCELSFTVTVPDTTVLLDGQPVDLSMPVTVTYGTHSLQAAATGYSAWSRQLVVNSETANIIIDLTENAVSSGEESTESTDTVQGTTGDSTQSDSSESTTTDSTQTGVTDSSQSSTQSGNSGSTQTNLGNSLITDEAESDSTNTATESYLKTLSGIMDTLTGE